MRSKSFTLIEVLVAMGIFVVGIAPLMGVLTATARNTQAEYKKDNTGKLAMDLLNGYMGETGISSISKTESDFPGLFYRQVVTNIVSNDFDKISKVELAIGPKDDDFSDMYSANLTFFTYLHIVE